ncbi:hypothetical protein KR51_00034320 [Rubidibacter lacunae KORDI 51-2]|uniref:Uncharacterized protein n=1 Tax=Rubidibacter lacunae KORDI 51-2 TaxID=582515 RepID=U5DFW1_9CHRO|nr:hypothetical protein KR51_00034320 [Rubidibacter lacunae KORDI 51-2]
MDTFRNRSADAPPNNHLKFRQFASENILRAELWCFR